MLGKILDTEKKQLPCWIPVFIAIGILLSFKISTISYWILTPLLLVSFFLRFYFTSLRIIGTVICCIIIGFMAMQIRIKTIDSPVLAVDEKFFKIKGRIDNIIPIEHGFRIILSDLQIRKLPKAQIPHKIRLTVRTSLNEAKIGDIVKLNAILSKPMPQYLPDSYNFSRDAYFKQIGAVGYSVSEFTVVGSDNSSWMSKLNRLRNNIQARVNLAIGSYYGSIATALMINEYSNIDKKILGDLRATGLAHILSVSGMHLSLVAAIFFFTSRFLLNCFESVALRLHCKKIAALISLLGSLAYLLISGMEVAAIRSFIMTSMIIIAIIIDRTSTPMRAIALAATIILLIAPENIIHPSFQMSFAAVLALIACFELFSKLKFDFANFNLVHKALFYLLSLSFASLVAGLATTPFVLYHFNQSSNYSILANLLAVPITSFWLMPLVVLTFILLPFHLEFISLYLMKWGINLMIKIANYIAELPHSVTIFAKLIDVNLLIIVLGMLWFCVWQTKLRLIGIVTIVIGVISQCFVARPDIFIDWENKKIAVLDGNKQLIFLNRPLGKFKRQLVMNNIGAVSYSKYQEGKFKQLACKLNECIFIKDKFEVKIDREKMQIAISKDGADQRILTAGVGAELIYIK